MSGGRTNRRGFLGALAGAAAAAYAAVTSVALARHRRLSKSDKPENAASIAGVSLARADLPAQGEAVHVRIGETPAVLVRGAGGELRAFDARCTHRDCTVGWSRSRGRFECPCHGGVFDGSGEPVEGPPDRPLAKLEMEEREDTVVVRRL